MSVEHKSGENPGGLVDWLVATAAMLVLCAVSGGIYVVSALIIR
jgi:hypothetical protein